MKNNFEVTLSGYKRIYLCIKGKKKDNDTLSLLVDNKEVKLNVEEQLNHNSIFAKKDTVKFFTAIAYLKRSSRNIKLYFNDELVYEYQTNYFKTSFLMFKKSVERVGMIGKKIIKVFKRHGGFIPPYLLKRYFISFLNKFKVDKGMTATEFYNPLNQDDYNKWLDENKEVVKYEKFKYNPLISIIIPVYNVDPSYLEDCLDSVLEQTYTNFEICIADDHSTNKDTIKTLKEYEKKDKRIKVVYRKKNGHISEASNSAIEIAKGEFISLLDNDDVLDKDALYYVVKELNNNKKLDLIYTDEDKLDFNGLFKDPYFKPDYAHETFTGANYICHFTTIRKSLVDEVGGFDSKYNGAQDYDLFLRIIEKTKNIYHIPRVLYHWRMSETSTAANLCSKNYAVEASVKALEAHFKRIGKDATITFMPDSNMYYVNYVVKKEPKISILIPTRDLKKITERCLKSIYKRTNYKNFEIVLLDNGSVKKETLKMFDKYKNKYDNFKVVRIDEEFNYSRINNIGAKEATGEYLVLLNNDIEVISENWLTDMVGYAMQEDIGCVGAKLLYPERSIQHVGVLLGLGGIAGHIYCGYENYNLGYFNVLATQRNVSAVTAACLMIKKSKYEKIGGLDEKLKVAYNDVDLNMKALEAGYRNVLLPHTILIHYESATRGSDMEAGKKARWEKEVAYMKNKWGNKMLEDSCYNINLSKNSNYLLEKKNGD